MNHDRDDERLGKLQVILALYNPAPMVLGLLGGFVYTSIVAILLSDHANELKGIVTLLLFAFSGLLAAFHFWQLGALDFTRLKAVSGLITGGNIFLFIGSGLILVSLFALVVNRTDYSRWNCAWLIWLILSILEQVIVFFKLRSILGICEDVSRPEK
jgi:hypothetical protein